MTTPAISVESVSVQFRPFIDKKPTLRRSLGQFRLRQHADVIALDDISFAVARGEAFGIIGQNGAGKSTLMRCIAGTLRPDSGRVVVNGRTSTLLQLGVGFNPQLSGDRNIYLGGLAAGLRRQQIDERHAEIVEYSELGDAIHRPVKTYSSGMFSRLSFAIAMNLDPDILLLDEVLAVGDEGFREKSLSSMRDLLSQAGTIVFVSHSLDRVESFCDRAMWMQNGRIADEGPATQVVANYRKFSQETPGKAS
jgi:ABC-type polysaccharide/polyol phosphate transport system ATPase subunit